MTDPIKTSQVPSAEAGIIENVAQFVFLTADWFNTNQKQLAQMLLVPDGQEITIQLEKDGQPEPFVLTGEALKGFKAGIIVATNIFGDLPFAKATDEQVEAHNAAKAEKAIAAAESEAAPAAANDAPAPGN